MLTALCVSGVPAGVLSGGQYDKLMRKMRRSARAIGFAVYLDMLERLDPDAEAYDVDTVLLYDEGADPAALLRAVSELSAGGESVTAQRSLPEKLRYRRALHLDGNEVRP